MSPHRPKPGSHSHDSAWMLPPLILHPFNESVPPSTLLDHSKAALMLSGAIASDGSDPEELQRRLLAGRYSEIRMLFYLGKDIFRWIDQCLDSIERAPEWKHLIVARQSFAALLTAGTPSNIREKMTEWGVADYVAIFSRAMGLHRLFSEPPPAGLLSDDFLRCYHRYADSLYQCFLAAEEHGCLPPGRFQFELYASGEYSRMLESEWSKPEQ